ncbi:MULTISPECIES: stage III sporulation protein AD [Bacillaceae]|uniref:Stage III sporulation protein AD n=3 Tax=Gottfriedia TaxID=2837503 RepID=A0ABY4JRG5_9BACI|nr:MULTISPECIES: stage III sporulation protein AD [Bacillaceae]ODG91554.1 stage III sporulation protein AD [Gottfriedia luciferensis]PEC47943.1 stage III sporulation protein AD [Bacillus sp. AFS096315]PFH84917.1 stage III sporulation protein AD [Bacillus sp. AFS088145]PFM80172.1 stage III sporulation protein AD [Bacillus sp. AFS077874]PGM52669.1 stage III sporulation protein AD [Bacillus sp. AFS053548]
MQIVGIGLAATFVILLLNQFKMNNFTLAITVFISCVLFLFLLDKVQFLLDQIQKLANQASIKNVYVETLLKIIGIAYIAEFGVQITKDAGQGAIASKIELGGKVLILVLAVPILTALIETILSFLPKIS